MSPGRRIWAIYAYGGLKDAYGHNKKLSWLTYTSSSTFEHQKIQYRELTSSKGSFTIKLPSSHDVDLIGVNLDPKYQIWNTSEPGNGSAWCQLVLENYVGGLNWPKHNFWVIKTIFVVGIYIRDSKFMAAAAVKGGCKDGRRGQTGWFRAILMPEMNSLACVYPQKTLLGVTNVWNWEEIYFRRAADPHNFASRALLGDNGRPVCAKMSRFWSLLDPRILSPKPQTNFNQTGNSSPSDWNSFMASARGFWGPKVAKSAANGISAIWGFQAVSLFPLVGTLVVTSRETTKLPNTFWPQWTACRACWSALA